MTEERAWIEAQLASLGSTVVDSIDVLHERPWSTVLRVSTDAGPCYFKASAPAQRHEPAIAAYLGHRQPQLVPPPMAIDPERGWMLMDDAGTALRDLIVEEHDVSRWLAVLPAYAGLQVELADAADDLLALGLPDMRLQVLPSRYEALLEELDGPDAPASELRRLREAIPRVWSMCAELARHGVPETIQHDDLNDGAVYVRDGQYRILDWGDACVSHPWFSMSVTLEGVIAWGPDDLEGSVDTRPFRDAYLEPFAAFLGARKVLATAELAIRLGWVCRAVNGHVPGIDSGATWTRLRMFLDGHP